LLSPSQFRDLASGRRRGLGAALLRSLLRLAEIPYTAAMRWRNWRYDTGAALVHRVPAQVVSVGNLTLGGTGKTPMVEWLARWFRCQGAEFAVVSRGYSAQQGALNDEALELRLKLPGVRHWQNPDRVAAAQEAIQQTGSRVILLDDAFQHRRMARDLDIVLLDALEPFGFGHVFPRGTLREPIDGLRRAHVLVLARADMLEPAQREQLRREASQYAPQAVWAEAVHAPRKLWDSHGQTSPVESLAAKRLVAFCGLGNPAGFRHTLAACGYHLADFREFADHYRYTPADAQRLALWARQHGAEAVVCTCKDLVKLAVDRLGSTPLWALGIELEFLSGQEPLEARLRALLESVP